MLLTITLTRAPATDLGYLLHKHPQRLQTFELPFGRAQVFYPETGDACCTVALLLDVDPVGLVRNSRGPAGTDGLLDQYVNDRPYAATSFLSVAIARVFGTALAGNCAARAELAEQALPLTATLPVLPCRGGEGLLRRLFEPLGYTVTATGGPLDEQFPDWGRSPYLSVTLQGTLRLCDLLSHLYVLIPVLDDEKHYWVTEDEVEKLLRHGEGWLAGHPEREQIARRYLKHQGRLARAALARLMDEDQPEPDTATPAATEEKIEQPLRLNDERLGAVVAVIRQCGARRVLDLGCGEGKLIQALLAARCSEEIVGMDVSHRSLAMAAERLHLDRLPESRRKQVRLLHGSLLYRDQRLAGFDAAALVEVIEHLDPPRLAACERSVFEFARPGTVIVTTPNAEYNVRFAGLVAGNLRHRDHRFEWRRDEFAAWCSAIAGRCGYTVRMLPVGSLDNEVGAPTQMGVFSRCV